MLWFDGSVATAIAAAKQRNALFVVYVRGDDDTSAQMDATWEDPEVSQLCLDSGMVAIKFDANSEECQQFSQFYPVICVPCVSFISGETGVPLEGTAGHVIPSDFCERIRKVLEQMAKQSASPTGQAATNISSPPPAPVAAASNSSNSSNSSSSGSDVAAAAGASSQELAASAQPLGQEARRELSKLEKAARLRQKMEEIHQRKEAQKEEESRQKEIERRQVGQAVQKSMAERAEQESRRAAQEMRREKAEDRLAKERVREQIARDRAEKQARYDQGRQEREAKLTAAARAKEAEQAAGETAQRKVNMDFARIQFRLPDGSTLARQFPAQSPLREAFEFLQENVGSSLPEFTMSTTFPRRTFTPAELSSTFRELDLVPTAAVIVLPGRFAQTRPAASSSAVQPASSGGILATILAPLLFLWNLIVVFIFGRPGGQSPPEPGPAPGQQDVPPASRAAGTRPDSKLRRRVPGGEGSASRQEGNIHRLVTAQDEEDDNNTWNGNSTQQM